MTRSLPIALLLLAVLGARASADEVDEAIRRARTQVEEGQREAGLAALRELVAKYPDDVRPHWWAAQLLFEESGRAREAAETIGGYLERFPGNRHAFELLERIAYDCLDTGDADVARWCARRLIQAEPNEKNHLYLAALASYRMGDRASVRAACIAIIDKWPSNADARRLLATVYEDDGRFRDAEETYRALIEERPGDVGARIALASLLRLEFRDYAAAEKEFRSAAELSDPGSELRTRAEIGLEMTREEAVLAGRLREHRGRLRTLLIVVLAVFGAATAAVALLTRRRA